MKLAIVSDIHGNIITWQNCLNDIAKHNISHIYNLGDTVGYFPDSDLVINDLLRINAINLKGNHEVMLLSGDSAVSTAYLYDITRNKIHTYLHEIATWPDHKEINYQGKRVLLAHASPRDYMFEYVYENVCLEVMEGIEYDVVVVGHTHRPFVKKIGNKTIVNVGSVGLPRDPSCGCTWAMIDLDQDMFEINKIYICSSDVINKYSSCVDSTVLAKFKL